MNRKIILLPLSFAAILALAACNPSTNSTTSVTPVESSSTPAVATVTSVTVTAADSATSVAIGGTLQLSAAVVGTNNPSTLVTWSSSADATATVSASGLVTGVAAGSVTITATSKADTTKKGTITLSVAEKIDKVSEMTAVGTVYNIKAVVIGKDLQDVAFSDGTGIIYAYFGTEKTTDTYKIADFAIGDYYNIKAPVGYYYGVYQLYPNGGTDSNKATVAAFTSATKLTDTAPTIDKTPVEFTSAMIDAHKASPSDWSNKAIKFIKYESLLTIEKGTSYDTFHTTVGTYDTRLHSLDTTAFSGLVDGGLYDIVALDFGYNSGNGYQNVLVTSMTKKDVALTGLSISGDATVYTGKKITLTAVAAPAGADKSVTWSSSDTASATVDASGVVTGVKAAASVTITATSTVTSTISATKVISVVDPTPVAVPAAGVKITSKTLKDSSAASAGWNAIGTTYAKSAITSTLNGIEVVGAVHTNVMFNTYEPWKTIGADLGYDVLQIKAATGSAFEFGAPFTKVTSVTINCFATASTLDATKVPNVSVAGTKVAITTALSGTSYAGTKLKDVTYTSGSTQKTDTIYTYSLSYDVSGLANQWLSIDSATASKGGTVYFDSIAIA